MAYNSFGLTRRRFRLRLVAVWAWFFAWVSFWSGVGLFMVGLVLAPAPAQARRRESKGEQVAVPQVVVATPVRFGDTVLSAGTYGVSAQGDRVTFLDGDTLVAVGTFKAKPVTVAEAELPEDVEGKSPPEAASSPANLAAQVDWVSADGVVTLTLRFGERLYRLSGREVAGAEANGKRKRAVVQKKRERDVVGKGVKAPDKIGKLRKALHERYLPSLNECGTRAQEQRWLPTEKRLHRCLCGPTKMWLFPRVGKKLVLHEKIDGTRAGISLTVSAKGAVTSCRAWPAHRPPKK